MSVDVLSIIRITNATGVVHQVVFLFEYSLVCSFIFSFIHSFQNREYGSFEYGGSAKKDAYPKDNRLPYNADAPKNAYNQRNAYPQTDVYSAKYNKDSYGVPSKSPYGSASDKKY